MWKEKDMGRYREDMEGIDGGMEDGAALHIRAADSGMSVSGHHSL